MELLAVVDDLLHQVAGEQLRHADLLHRRLLAVEEIACPIGEPARCLDGGEVLDQPVTPDLELGQRLAEGAALVAVPERVLDEELHAGDRADGRHQPLALEVRHHVVEALVLLAEKIADGNPAILEEEQRGVRGEVADLRQLLRDAEPLHVGRERHQRHAAVSGAAGAHREGDEVRPTAVRDPHLGAVDHVVVAGPARGRAEVGHVAAGVGLGDAQGGDLLSRQGGDEELLLLLFGADFGDDRRRHLRLDQESHVDAGVLAPDQLLGEDHHEPVIPAGPTDALRVVDPESADLGQPAEHFAGKDARLVPLQGVRRELSLDVLAKRPAEELVLRGEGRVHREHSSFLADE